MSLLATDRGLYYEALAPHITKPYYLAPPWLLRELESAPLECTSSESKRKGTLSADETKVLGVQEGHAGLGSEPPLSHSGPSRDNIVTQIKQHALNSSAI